MLVCRARLLPICIFGHEFMYVCAPFYQKPEKC